MTIATISAIALGKLPEAVAVMLFFQVGEWFQESAVFLDALTDVKTVVFDKTGTLTKGNFQVTDIVTHNGVKEPELLELAATVESQSTHPVAQSICHKYGQTIDPSRLDTYQEISGHGIIAEVNQQVVVVGNDRLLHREQIPHEPEICQL